MSKKLVFDEEEGYITSLKKKVKEIRKTVKNPKSESITLNDVYELLIKILEVIEEVEKDG